MRISGYESFVEDLVHSILLDTSFFIRLLKEDDPLHRNALGYFQYFLRKNVQLVCSTISVAEYCVRGKIDELPLRNLHILPFNINHAERAGILAQVVFKNKGLLNLANRTIIPNDTKLFAQADIEVNIEGYLTSDAESFAMYNLLKRESELQFKFLNLYTPHTEEFGILIE